MIYQRGSTWYTDVYTPDPQDPSKKLRKRVSTGHTDRALALVEAAKLKAGMPMERKGAAFDSAVSAAVTLRDSDERTLGEAFDYMRMNRWKGTSTAVETGRIAKEIEAFFGGHVLLSSINREKVTSLIAYWSQPHGTKLEPRDPCSPQRIQRKLAVLSVTLREMAQELGVKANVHAVPKQKPAKVRHTYLDESTFAALAKAETDPESRAFWTFLGENGGRYGEAQALTWNDVDFKSRIVTYRNVDNRRTKSENDRAVPITPAAYAALKFMQDQGRETPFGWLQYTGWKKRFEKACKAASIVLPKGTKLHVLRHTCGTLLVARGADMREVQEWYGHADIKTSSKYAKALPKRLRQLADSMGSDVEKV